MNTPDQDLTQKFMEGAYHEGVGYTDHGITDVMPDNELKDKIMMALEADMHVDASNILVDVHYGEVQLSGTVTNRQMLNAVKECVGHFLGVKKIEDHLVIQVPE